VEKWNTQENIEALNIVALNIKRGSSDKIKDPKRGKSAYIFFCAKKREEAKANLGEGANVTSELGRMWNSLKASTESADKKFLESLKAEAANDKTRYNKEMEDYVSPYAIVQKDPNNLIRRKNWNGPGGMRELILEKTGCTPFTACGISYRKAKRTTILKSVDNTPYYDDDLEDSNTPEYTLFGHNGDQDENERKFNEPLLNESKTKHIYLYRQLINKQYIWYGKYKIIGKKSKLHKSKDDDSMRNIIILILKRCL